VEPRLRHDWPVNETTRTAALVALGLLSIVVLLGFAFALVLAIPVLVVLGVIAFVVARR
jgi:hypothetical protein